MKRYSIVIGFLVAISFANQVLAELPDQDLKQRQSTHRLEVLDSRLYQFLDDRHLAVQICSQTNRSTDLKQYLGELSSKLQKHSHQKEDVIESLALYQKGFQFEEKCRIQFSKFDQQVFQKEKKPFAGYIQWAEKFCARGIVKRDWCQKNFSNGIKEIAPHCQIPNVANFDGTKSNYVCYAGDELMAKTMQIDKISQANSLEFLNGYIAALESTKNKKIDLYQIFLDGDLDNIQNREKFMMLLAFFYTSENSNVGNVDGWVDYLITQGLKDGQPPEKILKRFETMKKLKDSFFYYNEKSRADHVRTFIGAVDFTNKNHHDIHSAFMGCHYRQDGIFLSLLLPRILGYGYESIEAVHDFKDGVSTAYLITNFTEDVARHSTSSWGYHFCTMDGIENDEPLPPFNY